MPDLIFRRVDGVPGQEVRAQLHGDRRAGVHCWFLEWSPSRTVIYTEYDPGLTLEVHGHRSDHVIYILDGLLRVGDVECRPGSMILLEHGAVFGPLVAGPDGTRLLEFYTGDPRPVSVDPEGYLALLAQRGIVPLPHPDFEGKSMGKSKYLDSLVELDHWVGQVLDKVRELGIEQDTLVVWTTDNGAWQDVYPDCGYTPFRGTKGTDYEGGSRVPAIAWWPGTIEPGRRNSEIVGSLDFMATFATLAGLTVPTADRDGVPTMFDSCDQTALLRGEGPSTRDHWFYMTETELIPGAVRVGKWKAIWNIREGWKGEREYTNIAPELFDLWNDPGERYDRFMNGWAEKTWQAPQMGAKALSLLPTYQQYPNRELQTAGLSGAVFGAEDAQVMQQVQKLMHAIASNK